VRVPDPLALVVERHPALDPAVDLDVGGVQVDRDVLATPQYHRAVDVKEVDREDAIGLRAQYLPPGGLGVPDRRRWDSVVLEDPPDRRSADIPSGAGHAEPATPSAPELLIGQSQTVSRFAVAA